MDSKATDVMVSRTRAHLAQCSLVLMCALLTGCATNSPDTHSTNGTLSGRALLYGGPADIHGTPALTGAPGRGIVITIEKDGQFIASSTTGPDGRFTFSLPAGIYKITGCSDITVDVRAGQQTVQDLICPIP